jgi:hypothetical protein
MMTIVDALYLLRIIDGADKQRAISGPGPRGVHANSLSPASA